MLFDQLQIIFLSIHMFLLLTQTKSWTLVSKQNHLFKFLFKFGNWYINFDLVCMMDFSWVMYVKCRVDDWVSLLQK
jgi:hypothetical protein